MEFGSSRDGVRCFRKRGFMVSKLLTLAFVIVAICGVFLMVATYQRTIDATVSPGGIGVEFVALQAGPAVGDYSLTLRVTNGSGVSADIESVSILLRHDGRLIASGRVSPDGVEVGPDGESVFEVTLSSNLDPDGLPSPEASEAEDWSIGVQLTLGYSIRADSTTIRREAELLP